MTRNQFVFLRNMRFKRRVFRVAVWGLASMCELVFAGHGPVDFPSKDRVMVAVPQLDEKGFSLRVDTRVVHRFAVDIIRAEIALFDGSEPNFALVEAVSGGALCPYRYWVVEIPHHRPARISPEFGTCREVDRAVVRSDGFHVWMYGRANFRHAPTQAPLWTDRFEMHYRWSFGRLTVRSARVPDVGTRK